jgi:uncharacterized damage-inducible protein DinB
MTRNPNREQPMESGIVEAWRICNEITFGLLAQIPGQALSDSYTPRTRTVAAQFAHIHYVRVRNLQLRGPDHLGQLQSFPKGAQPGKKELKSALQASGKAVADLLRHCEIAGKVKSWSGPPSTYLGYLISHEAHHRALATVALRLGGHKLPASAMYDTWYRWRKKGT